MNEELLESCTVQVMTDGKGLRLHFPTVRISGGIPSGEALRGANGDPYRFCFTPTGERHEWVELVPLGSARCVRQVYRDPEGFTLFWTVGTLLRQSGVFITASVLNGTGEPVRLRRIDLLSSERGGMQIDGAPDQWMLMSPKASEASVGDLATVLPSKNDRERQMWAGFNMPIPHPLPVDEKSNDGRWRSFRDFCTLTAERGAHALAAAAVTTEADVDFDWFVEKGAYCLEILSQMSDVLLEPGEWRQAETVALIAGSYDEAVGDLYRWVAATHGSRTHREAMYGWCSWYDMGPRISASHTIELARAVRGYRSRIPMMVIQIDDGFQRQVGDWECNDTFPDGFQPVVEAIRDAGAKPGIWLAPLAVHETVGGPNYTAQDGRIVDVHPEWFQRDALGQFVGEADNWTPRARWLDPTHPGAAAFLRRTLRRMRQEGFEYFKIDFNQLGDGVRWHDPRKTRFQVYRDLYRLYREEIGEDAYLLSCSGFTRGTIGFADASRIGPDSCAIWRAPHPCCVQDCIRALGVTAHANGVFYHCDPDVSYTKPRMQLTDDELRTWHSFVGLLGGLALVSEPLQKAEYQTDASLRMMEILTPPATEKGRPLHPGTDPENRRFGFIVHRPWADFACVLLYNPENEVTQVSLDAPLIQALGSSFHAWSFWDSKYLGEIRKDFAATLQPHQCMLLRLTAIRTGPALVGSDLHISMGAAEILSFRSDGDHIEVVFTDAGARSGNLLIAAPGALQVVRFEGIEKAEIISPDPGLYCICLRNRQRGEVQRLQLKCLGDTK